ncbi:MAG: glycosyltransferase family 2 protein, partial [bacterium]|nr:glycosyltransferase family 2 protein [bacterium]
TVLTDELLGLSPHIRIIHNKEMKSHYVWERLAALRKLGTQRSKGECVVLLDDDNFWESAHLSSLFESLQKNPGCEAAHSWRTLWNSDNTPHIIKDLYPWVLGGDRDRQRILFRIQNEAGILQPGTNLARDRYGFVYKNKRHSCVDAGEWMFRRSLLDKIPFRDYLTYTELLYGFCDDYIYGTEMVKQDINVTSTEKPTLRYLLGGQSQELAQAGNDVRGRGCGE